MESSNVVGIHHPGIVVPDLERAVRFYCRVFSMVELHRGEWETPNDTISRILGVSGTSASFALLKIGRGFLELFEYTQPSQPKQEPDEAYKLGIRHICFEVTDPSCTLSIVEAEGGSVMNQPQGLSGGGTAVYCRDPFGNLIELTTAAGRMPSLNG